MNGAHVSGGAVGAVVAAILSPLLSTWGLGTLPDSTYALIGSLGLALGVGLGHVIATQGLWPAVKRVFVGPPKKVVEISEASRPRTVPVATAPATAAPTATTLGGPPLPAGVPPA